MKTNKALIKLAGILTIIILVCWGGYELISNMAFSFTLMLIVAILSISLLYVFHVNNIPEIDATDDNKRRRFSVMIVGCFGLIAIYTMSNYFYPSKEVFSNNDHHAIAVEGIKSNQSSLLLAADSKDAFFDDHTMVGSIELADVTKASATLNINGAGMPIYWIDTTQKNSYYVALEGQENIHSWNPQDQLELLNESQETVATLKVEYSSSRKNFHKVWHGNFILDYIGNDGNHHVDTSAYQGVIRRRYSLAYLFPGVGTLQGVDFTKVELLRPKARLGVSSDDDEELIKTPFLIGYSNGSGLGSVRSGNITTNTGTSCIITAALDGRCYTIGLFNSIPDFRLSTDTTNSIILRYRMPLYRSLNTEGYKKGENGFYTFMIASTLIDENGEVNSQIPQNVLLYDVFDNNDNRFQMRPQFISFQRGNTREPLLVSVLDNVSGNNLEIKMNDAFPNIATIAPDTYWLVKLKDFRAPSTQTLFGIRIPFKTQPEVVMMFFMLLMTIMCCISLMVKEKNFHTYLEPIAYIVILSLLTIRFTLHWRASVFPPMNGISLAEFSKWRNSNWILREIEILSFALVLLVIINKKFSFAPFSDRWSVLKWLNPSYWLSKAKTAYPIFSRTTEKQNFIGLLFPQGKSSIWIVLGLLAYIFILLLGFAMNKQTIFCIGVPVVWYFIIDFLINKQVGSCWTDKDNNSYAFFWQSVINMLMATSVMFMLDGGYGLLFFVFSLLSMVLRLIDLYACNGYNKETKQGVHRLGVILITICVVFFIAFLRSIVIKLYTGSISSSIIAGLVAALFVFLLIWTVGGWSSSYLKNENKNRRLACNITFVAAALLLTIGAGFLLKQPKVAQSHIANRIMVIAKEPSDVLGKAASTPDMRRFLEASLNDWVLEEYEQRGKEVNAVIGEHGHGYFKLQPHSNVGVSWMTQLTDLSVSRFIIAEQSTLVPILLIALFLAMVITALFFPSDRRWAKSLLIQIPLLLTVQGLLVWMAVTRRFVFLGQDFPMISMISRANLYMSILGFLIWILTALIENWYLRCELEYYHELNINKSDIEGLVEGKTEKGNMYRFLHDFGWFSTLSLIFALAVIIIFQPQRHFKNNTYDVIECVEATRTLITDHNYNSIETLFREYQDQILEEAGNKKDITKLGTPQQILSSFCQFYGYSPDALDNDDTVITRIFEQDANYGVFAKAAFDDFIKHKVNQNDIDELIYIVKRRYITPDNPRVENVRYTFDITARYFRQQLPKRIDKSWRGSITAAVAICDNFPQKHIEGKVNVYSIPSSWSKNKRPSIIVKPNTGQYSVVGKYEPRRLNINECYYLSEGEMLTGSNVPNLAKYGSGNYLAKNVYINSQPRFIYPMQTDFYWSRPIAEQISSYMNHEMDAAKNKSEYEELMMNNSDITLSIELTKHLVDSIDKMAKKGNVAVVVADGDGCVRALVDHKKQQYLINPNDSRRIQFVEDSLKREGMLNRGHEAERFFGNKAILSLNNGPGSSQKPIVWTAVTTQYSGWDWNSLSMAAINKAIIKDPIHDPGHYDATSFAGGSIAVADVNRNTHFYSLTSDEGNGSEVNVQAYMRKSSNYYNAIMVYIGSHTKAQLEAGIPKNNPLFISRDASWCTKEDSDGVYRNSLFPLIKYDNMVYSFASPLTAEDISSGGILLDGLRENFNLIYFNSNDKHTYLHKSLKDGIITNYNAFPQISFFKNEARKGRESTIKQVTTEGIKMTAIGKNSAWIVSPLKMAEMYGKLISFNKNYRLTLDPNAEKMPYQAFNTDGSEKNYLIMRNKQFIPGMKEVFTDSRGTAYDIYTKIKHNLVNKYYIYGKTGTINGNVTTESGKQRREEDHLLAVVITNKKIESLDNLKDYQNLKYYVIYIADFDYSYDGFSWKTTDAAIINTVLESNDFKEYMERK